MKKFRKPVAMAAAAVALFLVNGAAAQKSAPTDIIMLAEQMKFEQVIPGVSKMILWGNASKGRYGSITRFVKGTFVSWHTHPHDIKVVVISGTLLYDNGSGEKRLGPGSFLQERSSIKHTTAAAADSDLVFFEDGAGPFAVNMSK